MNAALWILGYVLVLIVLLLGWRHQDRKDDEQ